MRISTPIIGMFGTCDESHWRDRFIAEYKRRKIRFYNPQLPPGTWDPKMADVEKRHLATDDLILFPVLAESWGFGSLGETGFSVKQALELNKQRNVIVMIEDHIDPALKAKELELMTAGAWAKVAKHFESAALNGMAAVLEQVKAANTEALQIAVDQMEKANLRARRLVMAHLREEKSDSVWVVDNLDQMFDLSLVLHGNTQNLRNFRQFNPRIKFAKVR